MHTPPRPPATTLSRDALLRGLFCLAVGACAFAGGCQDPLFSPTEPRSQYDRFDAVRDRRAPAYLEDEFGTRRANLRGRLLTDE